MTKTLLMTASVGALLLAPAFASAATTTVSDQDKEFAVAAALGGKTEVATSKIALKKSSNDQLKSFAQEMVEDHGEANKKLMAIAKKQNIMLPAALDSEHQAEVDSLKKATGSDFDAKYTSIQEKEHSDAVTAFQKEIDTGTNTALVAFASKTLPTIQQHVQNLKKEEGQNPPNASATSGSMGSMPNMQH